MGESMREIYNLNRSVAGHFLEVNNDQVKIYKGLDSFCLDKVESDFECFIDEASLKVEGMIHKGVVSGWAYDKKTSAPLSSIYIEHAGRLIAISKRQRRIDVRVKLNLAFDQTGFLLSFNLPNRLKCGVSLVMVYGNKVQLLYLKLKKCIDSKKLNEFSILGAPVKYVKNSSFEYKIDSYETGESGVSASGWAFFRSDPDVDVYVGFLSSGSLLGPLVENNKHRPDVVSFFMQEGNKGFYGFDFLGQYLNLTEKVSILLVAPELKVAEVISLDNNS